MKNLKEVVEILSYNELLKLNRDLTPESEANSVISNRIPEMHSTGNKACSVCGNLINPYFTDEYSLVFGPADFRKKTAFCGIDCLEYFFVNLKKMSKRKLQSSTTAKL